MNYVDVYGFGSFFNSEVLFNDVDLLLVHADRSKKSCILAINCKRKLQNALEIVHITMLSREAEQSFQFMRIAKAEYLGRIEEIKSDEGVEIILTNIRQRLRGRIYLNKRVT